MKAFKRYSAARQEANGEPIIRIGDLYIVGVTKADGYLTEISLISSDGFITGNVTVRHLDRLGNANHAKPGDSCNHYATRIWPDSVSVSTAEKVWGIYKNGESEPRLTVEAPTEKDALRVFE